MNTPRRRRPVRRAGSYLFREIHVRVFRQLFDQTVATEFRPFFVRNAQRDQFLHGATYNPGFFVDERLVQYVQFFHPNFGRFVNVVQIHLENDRFRPRVVFVAPSTGK